MLIGACDPIVCPIHACSGISIKPAYCFTSDAITEVNDYFRVGFGEEKMPKALAALSAFVEANKSGWL